MIMMSRLKEVHITHHVDHHSQHKLKHNAVNSRCTKLKPTKYMKRGNPCGCIFHITARNISRGKITPQHSNKDQSTPNQRTTRGRRNGRNRRSVVSRAIKHVRMFRACMMGRPRSLADGVEDKSSLVSPEARQKSSEGRVC